MPLFTFSSSPSCGRYGCSADVWSLGILVFELANAEPPYYDLQQEQAALMIGAGEAPVLRDLMNYKYDPRLHDFTSRCLRVRPSERPSVEQLLQHPFIALACSHEEWVNSLHRTFKHWPSLS